MSDRSMPMDRSLILYSGKRMAPAARQRPEARPTGKESMVTEFRRSPSYPQLLIGEDGSVIGPSGRQLRLFPNKQGYLRINVYERVDGVPKWKQLSVHILVCEAFHGPKPEWAELVAHADGVPGNAHAENLRWATYKENEADKRQHGRSLLGERHHQAKLSPEDARQIRADRAAGTPLRTLSERYGVGLSQVSRIARGESWGHLP